MSLQIVALLALVAVAAASPGGAYLGGPNHRNIYRNQDVFGNYQTGYQIADGLTGDVHGRHEVKKGYGVAGSYSQVDPNGYVRHVDYVADPYGARQVITGSENGLYVNTHSHSIRPNAAPIAKAVVGHGLGYGGYY